MARVAGAAALGGLAGPCLPLDEVGVEVRERKLAERNQPALATLAERGDHAALRVDIAELQAAELAHAQPGGVRKAEHGAVAQAAQGVGVGRLDQAHQVVLAQRVRQAAAEARSGRLRRGIGGQDALSHEEAHQAASGGEVPGGAAGAETALGEGAEPGTQEAGVEAVGLGHALRLGEGDELREIAGVGLDGVRREGAFDAEVVEEEVDEGVEGHGVQGICAAAGRPELGAA